MDCLHTFEYRVTYRQLIWHVWYVRSFIVSVIAAEKVIITSEYMRFNGFRQRPQVGEVLPLLFSN